MKEQLPIQFTLHRLLQLVYLELERELHALSVKNGQGAILLMLYRHKDLSQRELAKYLHVKPPSITVALQKMEEEKLIERVADQYDLRILRLHLTPKGETLAKGVHIAFAKVEKEVFTALNEEEITTFRLLCERIENHLEEKEPRV